MDKAEKVRISFNKQASSLADGLKVIKAKRLKGSNAGVDNLSLVYKYIQFVYGSKDMKGKEFNTLIASKVLKISKRSIAYCINTLNDIGLIKVSGKGIWKVCSRSIRLSKRVYNKARKLLRDRDSKASYEAKGAAFKLINMCFHKGFKKGVPFKRLVKYAAKKATTLLEDTSILIEEDIELALSRYSENKSFISALAHFIKLAL